jgi:AbrB family looped-hinge helix DNA binding protein
MRSRLSSTGRVTIPKAARAALGASAGDVVSFEIAGDALLLRKVGTSDPAFRRALSVTLDEWTSRQDEQAFAHL